MNYKITEHYARGEEKFIAEFNELNDARFFMTKKSSIDDVERKKVIYRLYDDHELLHELNKENISITHAKYAEGNGDFNNAVPFIFQVMIKTMDSLERKTIAQFNDKNDANLFVVCKFEDDNTVHDNDLFLIFKDKILIDTVNKTITANRKKESSGSSGNEKGSTYKLSPLSTRPTPGGGPADYWVKNEDE
ncbi:TPA: hypothetical protein F7001_02725 [Legionella pneumophila]|uniref:Uncharacterized protein n=1 Tax=Legionella fallonii LLAP-10 TaxID=1212491 RepID=A0A098G9Y1_9GAMM|nr:hypothetical protein [Legionella fallonii]CEG58295.1 conserved protein of unknown function [Legionella fallonii LLAP-10]HAU3668152.1 hypothetical protein [Legionella pneumophila]